MPVFEELFAEADRQLRVCNACRYCEGYCPVFPSLARLRELDQASISHLANVCHDCRDCYHACMYNAPHVFALNIPVLLASVRRATYARAAGGLGRVLGARGSVAAAGAAFAAILLGLVAATVGLSVLVHGGGGASSPYRVVSYPAILGIGLGTFCFALVVMGAGLWRYWVETRPRPVRVSDAGRVTRALSDALSLEHMRGGGAGCDYPGESPSAARRWFHLALANGFFLCVVSTIAAAIAQDGFSVEPPYPYLSVPVLAGLIGGIGLVVGTAGLLALKARAEAAVTDAEMTRADLGLLYGLGVLGVTGLATLFVRTTPAYGIVLVVHLSAVFSCFVLAPFTKFVHAPYRAVALIAEELSIGDERRAAARG